MTTIIYLIAALIVIALLVHAIGLMPLDVWISSVLRAGVIVVGALIIAQRFL